MAFWVLKWFLFVYAHLLQLLSPCISLRDSYTTLVDIRVGLYTAQGSVRHVRYPCSTG